MAERLAAGGRLRHATSAPVFSEIDTDGNGGISPDEFAAHRAAVREKNSR